MQVYNLLKGFPHNSVGKESTCNARDPCSTSGLGRSPGEGKGYPLQYSGLDNSMDCNLFILFQIFQYQWILESLDNQTVSVGTERILEESILNYEMFYSVDKVTSIWRYWLMKGFPGGTSGKEPACQRRRHKRCGFNPWVRKIS